MEQNITPSENPNVNQQPHTSTEDEQRLVELEKKFSRENRPPIKKAGWLSFSTSPEVDKDVLNNDPRFQAFQQVVPIEDITEYMNIWRNGRGEMYDLLYQHSLQEAKDILYQTIKKVKNSTNQ